MKRSVAIIGTRGYPSYYGGFETAVRKLAPYLVDQGWDVTVYGRPGAIKPGDPSRDKRVRVLTTRGLESKSLSTLSYGLTSTVNAAVRKPDVALVMNVANGFWFPFLRLRGIPILTNVDGIEWERAKWGRIAKFIFHTGAKVTARFGTRMVYDSEEIARRWSEEFGLQGDFIPYGGDTETDLPLEPGTEHRGYILAVARFVPENTIPEFLAAVELLGEKYKVVIVGSEGYGGDLDQRVSDLAAKFENVIWTGHMSDDRRLHALWQHAGAYFHGHSVGGTNPALVQAMACGAPIVARDTVYNREVLADSAVFSSPSAADIASVLSEVMDDSSLQSRLSAAALARAVDKYSWDQVCAKYERSLTNLIKDTNAKGA